MFNPKVTIPLALSATLFASSLANAQTTTDRSFLETTPGNSATTVKSVPGTTTTETDTTTTTGLVSEIAPDGFIVRTENGTTPIRYSSSASTTYVDEAGRPVARELVTSGLPVTVRYRRVGERLIAEHVVVRKPTSTTNGATVIERNTTVTPPPIVVEKPVVVEKKVPVVVEKKVYVDRPVVVEKKVFVDRPVVVEKPVEKPAPAAVIIEKKTTTTTTTTTTDKKDRD